MNTLDQPMEKERKPQKTYSQPKIVYETELETRAGSPLGYRDLEDPLSIIEP